MDADKVFAIYRFVSLRFFVCMQMRVFLIDERLINQFRGMYAQWTNDVGCEFNEIISC